MITLDIEEAVRKHIEVSKVLGPLIHRTDSTDFLNFAVLGLTEESGEVSGLAVRSIYKLKDVQEDRWLEELGDVLWYLVATILAKGYTIEEVWRYNTKKLEDRYEELKADRE